MFMLLFFTKNIINLRISSFFSKFSGGGRLIRGRLIHVYQGAPQATVYQPTPSSNKIVQGDVNILSKIESSFFLQNSLMDSKVLKLFYKVKIRSRRAYMSVFLFFLCFCLRPFAILHDFHKIVSSNRQNNINVILADLN